MRRRFNSVVYAIRLYKYEIYVYIHLCANIHKHNNSIEQTTEVNDSVIEHNVHNNTQLEQNK